MTMYARREVAMTEAATAIIHALPKGWMRTACCESLRSELPAHDRVTTAVAKATCAGAREVDGQGL